MPDAANRRGIRSQRRDRQRWGGIRWNSGNSGDTISNFFARDPFPAFRVVSCSSPGRSASPLLPQRLYRLPTTPCLSPVNETHPSSEHHAARQASPGASLRQTRPRVNRKPVLRPPNSSRSEAFLSSANGSCARATDSGCIHF